VDGAVATTLEKAAAPLPGGGDRASLKRQLQSLKSCVINLGQKCAFADGKASCLRGRALKHAIRNNSCRMMHVCPRSAATVQRQPKSEG
jgi:hypothetical protein